MIIFKVKNSAAIRNFCEAKKYNYEVVTDGWELRFEAFTPEDVFRFGVEYGAYTVSNPVLVTLEELAQRGDIPGL